MNRIVVGPNGNFHIIFIIANAERDQSHPSRGLYNRYCWGNSLVFCSLLIMAAISLSVLSRGVGLLQYGFDKFSSHSRRFTCWWVYLLGSTAFDTDRFGCRYCRKLFYCITPLLQQDLFHYSITGAARISRLITLDRNWYSTALGRISRR